MIKLFILVIQNKLLFIWQSLVLHFTRAMELNFNRIPLLCIKFIYSGLLVKCGSAAATLCSHSASLQPHHAGIAGTVLQPHDAGTAVSCSQLMQRLQPPYVGTALHPYHTVNAGTAATSCIHAGTATPTSTSCWDCSQLMWALHCSHLIQGLQQLPHAETTTTLHRHCSTLQREIFHPSTLNSKLLYTYCPDCIKAGST